MTCLECEDTGEALSGLPCGFCKKGEEILHRDYERCGNCDVEGLIPMGKTSDDCVVCGGVQWVKKS